MLSALVVQILWLFVLAIPIASVSWTVTHEEIFREPRDYCRQRSVDASRMVVRKFYYLFTCEFCFSHYVTILALIFTGYKLLLTDWRGYVVAGFALVWIANVYMSLFGMIRVNMKEEGLKAKIEEIKLVEKTTGK